MVEVTLVPKMALDAFIHPNFACCHTYSAELLHFNTLSVLSMIMWLCDYVRGKITQKFQLARWECGEVQFIVNANMNKVWGEDLPRRRGKPLLL